MNQCPSCKKFKHTHANGVCAACDKRRYKLETRGACSCGEPIVKRGMCQKCSYKYYLKKTASDGPPCVCGQVHYKSKMCRSCYTRWVKYKLTAEEQFEIMKEGCLVCGVKEGKMCIDHSHKTGAVRGCLCQPCNVALGAIERYGDCHEWLSKMKAYIDTVVLGDGAFSHRKVKLKGG